MIKTRKATSDGADMGTRKSSHGWSLRTGTAWTGARGDGRGSHISGAAPEGREIHWPSINQTCSGLHLTKVMELGHWKKTGRENYRPAL